MEREIPRKIAKFKNVYEQQLTLQNCKIKTDNTAPSQLIFTRTLFESRILIEQFKFTKPTTNEIGGVAVISVPVNG